MSDFSTYDRDLDDYGKGFYDDAPPRKVLHSIKISYNGEWYDTAYTETEAEESISEHKIITLDQEGFTPEDSAYTKEYIYDYE